MKLIALSLIDFDQHQLNSPEVILGLVSISALLIAIVIGFIYKRRQSRK